MSGDLVQVQLDADVFKLMQTEAHGGWNDRMAVVFPQIACIKLINLPVIMQFVGRLGTVDHLNDEGNLIISYYGEIKNWVLNPHAVVRVHFQLCIKDNINY